MLHLGDITKISGYDVPVVDVIVGGSPCQDLSCAGARAGMKHPDRGDEETTRSGLFMEQIRIVKEMRERERRSGRSGWAVRPRYMVWENVPGAFSSGKPKGADFAAVIEEIIKVCEPEAICVCVCVPDGGWPNAGCYYADDGRWSLAWRVHDGQFWGPTFEVDGRMLDLGTPQRRKRIALVADFGGLTAPEILFEREGVHRDIEPRRAAGEGTAAGTENRAGGESVCETEGVGVDVYNQSVTGTVSASVTVATGGGKPQRRESIAALQFPGTSRMCGGGKGFLNQGDRTGALSTLNNQNVFVPETAKTLTGGQTASSVTTQKPTSQDSTTRKAPVQEPSATNTNAPGASSPLKRGRRY